MNELNLFELFAKITLDDSEYNEKVGQASDKGSSLANTLKNGLAVAGKAAAAGLAAAGAAAVALGKSALGGYKEYEQLVGGVDTLFKGASQKLQDYADNAYQTAGMSANDYMANITSFSAALINSVGGDTEKAADMADRAITDMADNANKMGTSLDSIVQTYQSLSRGNFAMLDNLKLGYGGTKAELERLLEDAEAYKASMGEVVNYDVSNFADIVSAIGAIQEKMGIFNATAEEAATTIEGSTNSMKAAWSNLVTGIADENANVPALMENFLDSVGTVADNVLPRVKKIAEGIGTLVVSAAPKIMDAGRSLLGKLADGIVSGVPQMTARLPEIISGFSDFITENLPAVLEQGVLFINSLVDGIISGIPDMMSRLPQIVDAVVGFLTENGTQILKAGWDILVNLVTGIISGIPDMIARLPEIIRGFVDTIKENMPTIIQTGFDMLIGLFEGMWNAIPDFIMRLPEIFSNIRDSMTALGEGFREVGVSIIHGIWNGILQVKDWLFEKVRGIFDGIVGGVKDLLGIHSPSRVFAGIGENMALGLGEGWESEYGRIKSDIESGMNFGVGQVDFASSGLGVSSAGIVNGVSSAGANSAYSGGFTAVLNLPDNTQLARYYLPGFIDVAKSNGTPIANPVTA